MDRLLFEIILSEKENNKLNIREKDYKWLLMRREFKCKIEKNIINIQT